MQCTWQQTNTKPVTDRGFLCWFNLFLCRYLSAKWQQAVAYLWVCSMHWYQIIHKMVMVITCVHDNDRCINSGQIAVLNVIFLHESDKQINQNYQYQNAIIFEGAHKETWYYISSRWLHRHVSGFDIFWIYKTRLVWFYIPENLGSCQAEENWTLTVLGKTNTRTLITFSHNEKWCGNDDNFCKHSAQTLLAGGTWNWRKKRKWKLTSIILQHSEHRLPVQQGEGSLMVAASANQCRLHSRSQRKGPERTTHNVEVPLPPLPLCLSLAGWLYYIHRTVHGP